MSQRSAHPSHLSRPPRFPTLTMLLVGAFCISWAPIFVKVAARQELGPTSIAFWRLLIGAGLATIFAATQVFNTAGLNWLFLGERPRGRFFVAAAAGLLGVALVAGVGSGIAIRGDYARGVAMGLGTGLCYGGYLLSTRQLGRHEPRLSPITIVAWLSLGGAAASGLVCLFEHDAFLPRTPLAWWMLVALGAGIQGGGWWAIATALPRVSGATGGLVLLLQPVLATVWGWLLFRERLTPVQLAGAALTLGAIYAGTLGLRSLARAPQKPSRPTPPPSRS